MKTKIPLWEGDTLTQLLSGFRSFLHCYSITLVNVCMGMSLPVIWVVGAFACSGVCVWKAAPRSCESRCALGTCPHGCEKAPSSTSQSLWQSCSPGLYASESGNLFLPGLCLYCGLESCWFQTWGTHKPGLGNMRLSEKIESKFPLSFWPFIVKSSLQLSAGWTPLQSKRSQTWALSRSRLWEQLNPKVW